MLSDWGGCDLSANRAHSSFYPQFHFFPLLKANHPHALGSLQISLLSDNCLFQAPLLLFAFCREIWRWFFPKSPLLLTFLHSPSRRRRQWPKVPFLVLTSLLNSRAVMSILRPNWDLMHISKPSCKLALPPSLIYVYVTNIHSLILLCCDHQFRQSLTVLNLDFC